MGPRMKSQELGKGFYFSEKLCRNIEDAKKSIEYAVDQHTYREMSPSLKKLAATALVVEMDFFDFEDFPNLIEFHVENAEIKSIDEIWCCSKLEIVNINDDKSIKDFRPLLRLEYLRQVNLINIRPRFLPCFKANIYCKFEIDDTELIPEDKQRFTTQRLLEKQNATDLAKCKLLHVPGCIHVMRGCEKSILLMRPEQCGLHFDFEPGELLYKYYISSRRYTEVFNAAKARITRICYVAQEDIDLQGFTVINELILYLSSLTNTDQLAEMTTLRSLEIINCQTITDFSFLEKLENLETLVVINNLTKNIGQFYPKLAKVKFAFFSGLWQSGSLKMKIDGAEQIMQTAAQRQIQMWQENVNFDKED